MHSLKMNQDKQDWTSENLTGFISPAALSPLIQKINRGPTIVNLGRNFREPLRRISIPGNTPASFSERPKTASIFMESQSASLVPKTRALRSQLQQTGNNPAEKLPLYIRFQHDKQTSPGEKFLGSVSQHQGTTENVIKNQSASIPRECEELDSTQILVTQLNSPSKRQTYKLMPPSKKQKTWTISCSTEPQFASRKHETAICTKQKTRNFPYLVETFATRKKVTAVSLRNKEEKQSTAVKTMSALIEKVPSECSTQKTGLRPILGEPKSSSSESSLKNTSSQHFQANLDTASVSGVQRQTYELSSSEKQKSRTFSWSTESQSNPVKTVCASIQQVTSDRPKQQTGLHPILGEPKSPEFSIKNTFSEDYKSLQSTKIEKDVDRLVERLKQFDEFICVKCTAKFTSQDELLRHEPIHFDD